MSLRKKQAALFMSELSMHVRMNHANGIVDCLYVVKRNPILCQDFVEHNGLPIVVELLRSQNSTILNLSLSVLADVCTLSNARYKLRDIKIEDYLISILKDVKLNSTVHCRACRLVGNLAECSWHAGSLHNAGVVEPLAAILRLNTIRQTYLMAVRAIRNIWNIHEDSRRKILDVQAVRLVSQIFVMAKEKSDVDAKYTELVDICLKAMNVFLISLNIRCAEQMEADKDKRGYQCLVWCCNDGNKLAISCLYKLCRIGTSCQLVLSSCGAVEQLIALIKSSPNLMTDNSLSKEILASLCLFCQESVNRAKISNGGGLELILTLLKKPELERYHPMLLSALVQFSYCDTSITILTKHGMLEILVEKLANSIEKESDVSFNINSASFKRKRDPSCWRYGDTSAKKCRYNAYCFDGDSSPGSVASVSSSPPSTPPLSSCYSLGFENDNMDDDYSPVYSDTEWTDNDEEQNVEDAQDEEADSLKSYKSLTIDAGNSRDSDNSSKDTFCDHTALMLLYRMSVYSKPIELADPATIKALLNYIRHTKNKIAITILTRIVRNAVYFMPLLKQGFVFDVQKMHKPELYMGLLSEVAETGGAIGQLSSVLRRGEENLKLITAVSIPYILKSRVTLKTLLHHYGGLELIFRLLNEPLHELHERAIWSICRLARTLQIYPEAIEKCPKTVKIINDDDSRPLYDYLRSFAKGHPRSPLSTVTFVLDDGTSVDACRRTLCQRSDAFFAMLEGEFHESGKQFVRLRDTSRDGLRTLILAATGATYKHRNIESLLDAVLLADMFLMPDLLDELTNSSVAKLNCTNFSRAWCWARTNACHELKTYCIKSFLSANMTWNGTVQAFRDFSATEAFDEFLHDVWQIVADVLCTP